MPVTTCLWFDGAAEEAARFYTALLPESRIDHVSRYPPGGPGPEGSVLTVDFTLRGAPFVALNGGPQYQHSPAMSLLIPCASQAEVDQYWDALKEGGEEQPCGWVTDRFGVSWQIVPRAFLDMMKSGGDAGIARAFAAMLQMGKLDLATIEKAFKGP